MRAFLVGCSLVVAAACSSPPRSSAIPDVQPPRTSLESIFGSIPDCSAALDRVSPAGVVSILPGETICLRLSLVEGAIRPEQVPRISPDAIVMRFRVTDGAQGARLQVFNPHASNLKYRAGIRVAGDSNYYSTSSCPVISGGAAFESWGQSIEEILAADFHFLDASDSLVCD